MRIFAHLLISPLPGLWLSVFQAFSRFRCIIPLPTYHVDSVSYFGFQSRPGCMHICSLAMHMLPVIVFPAFLFNSHHGGRMFAANHDVTPWGSLPWNLGLSYFACSFSSASTWYFKTVLQAQPHGNADFLPRHDLQSAMTTLNSVLTNKHHCGHVIVVLQVDCTVRNGEEEEVWECRTWWSWENPVYFILHSGKFHFSALHTSTEPAEAFIPSRGATCSGEFSDG